ncbi:MAG: SDR family NAD(P)-dependent oxidoreductase, partial [Anaerolineae bacterium]|nr:SDR family NAD(P)-dependent oxidoreductase [Anaerolineae bacterium]
MAIPSPQKLLDFSGRTVIVTGSGSGLGRGIALRFAEAGAAVVVNYRASAAGAQAVVAAVEANGGQAIAVQADVTQKAEVERLVADTVERFGRIDGWVN